MGKMASKTKRRNPKNKQISPSVYSKESSKGLKKLHMGSGTNLKEGYVNLDKANIPGIDVRHDLEIFPYPFEDNEFDFVEATHVLEHLNDIPKVMRELWRITKKGGMIKIGVPHYSDRNAWSDLTHKHPFGWESLDYMSEDKTDVVTYEYYDSEEKEKFKIYKKMIFGRLHRFMGLEIFANRFPNFYELFLANIFPVRDLQFTLIVGGKK